MAIYKVSFVVESMDAHRRNDCGCEFNNIYANSNFRSDLSASRMKRCFKHIRFWVISTKVTTRKMRLQRNLDGI